jgi:lipopolysaccharide export LptBFGC system permease protein LptF
MGTQTNAERAWPRRGSPFAAHHTSRAAQPAADRVVLPSYPHHPGAVGAAAGAILLALIGFLVAFILPLATLIMSSIGLVLGYWSLKGNRFGASVAGLLLCCLAFAFGGLLASAELYRLYYGFSIWQMYGSL